MADLAHRTGLLCKRIRTYISSSESRFSGASHTLSPRLNMHLSFLHTQHTQMLSFRCLYSICVKATTGCEVYTLFNRTGTHDRHPRKRERSLTHASAEAWLMIMLISCVPALHCSSGARRLPCAHVRGRRVLQTDEQLSCKIAALSGKKVV